MARGPRRDAPDEVHHVWVRGLERGAIFRDDGDRLDLVARFSAVFPESGFRCLAWALLPNHYHLVLKRADVSLSRVMARVNSGYATRFNNRHGRVGFLFQNRFGSRIVDSDADLVSVVRYVARNPLKHGVCTDEAELDEYPWASLSATTGRRPAWPFESPSVTSAILGGRSAVSAQRSRAHLGAAPPPVAERSFEAWIEVVCSRLSVDRRDLATRRRSRTVAQARAAVCWIGVCRLGLSGAEVGSRLGTNRSSVSRALPRGRAVCRELDLHGPAMQQSNERPR
jgi:REP element-mobilizing transposase RayT